MDQELKNNKYDFSKPFNEQLLKNMSIKDLNNLTIEIRNLIIKQCSIYGGHLSSNLGITPLAIALYRYYSFPKDKIFFDVSHQTYAYKILTGRPLSNLRQENGIDGFSKIKESNYDFYNAGHSSTALSTAMGYAISRDLNKDDYEIITVIGDGSLGNGLSLEALNNLYSFNHRIIIIINDNKMSISKTNGLISKLLNKYEIKQNTNENEEFIKLDIGYFYKKAIDGEDFLQMNEAFKEIENINSPIFLYVRTYKGKGYSYAEKDTTGKWHHTLPFNVETGELLSNKPSKEQDTFSHLYTDLLLEAMNLNKSLVAITPATTYNENLLKIKEQYKDRFFDVGISEEHALVFANGLALNSYHPYLFIYSTFLQRGYDEILHDISNTNKQVTLMVGHAGLIGDDGETHQGIYDTNFLMGMPNISIAMANDYPTILRLFNFSLNYKYPIVIRYPLNLIDIKNVNKLPPLAYLEWDIIKEDKNKNICVISYGPKLNEVNQKINGITLINAIFTYPINLDYLKSLLDYKNIVIYDPYSTISGFTLHIIEALVSLDYKGKISKCAIPNEFVTKGTIREQEQRVKVDISSLKDIINKL